MYEQYYNMINYEELPLYIKTLHKAIYDKKNLKYFAMSGAYNLPLDNSLKNAPNLEEINIHSDFNQPLKYSLSNLPTLKVLRICMNEERCNTGLMFFNQPIGDSLKGLT